MSFESERMERRERRAEAAEQWGPVPRREFDALLRRVERLERNIKALAPRNAKGGEAT